jgi:hypothetical protein
MDYRKNKLRSAWKMNIKQVLLLIVTLCATLCVIQNYRSFHGIDDSNGKNDKGEERSFHHPRGLRAYNERLLATHHVGNATSTTTTTPRPYYLDGKQFGEIPPPEAPFRQHRLFHKRLLQHNNESSIVNVSSWMLVDPMTHPFRNHDSLLLEYTTTTTRTTTNNSSAGARASQEHAQEGGSLHTPQYTWPTFSLYSSHGFVDGQALGAQKHRCC